MTALYIIAIFIVAASIVAAGLLTWAAVISRNLARRIEAERPRRDPSLSP